MSSNKQYDDLPDVQIEFFIDEDGIPHWVYRDADHEFIAELEQPSMKHAFLEGYRHALRKLS